MRRIVARFAPRTPYLDTDDLMCHARLGLLQARAGYNPSIHRTPYRAYAAMTVRREVVAAIRAASPLPEHLRVYAARARAAEADLQAHGCETTDASVAWLLGVSETTHQQRRRQYESAEPPCSLNEARHETIEPIDGETLSEPYAGLMIELANVSPLHARIIQNVVITRVKQCEVLHQEHLNPEQVAQLKREALDYLRGHLGLPIHDEADPIEGDGDDSGE